MKSTSFIASANSLTQKKNWNPLKKNSVNQESLYLISLELKKNTGEIFKKNQFLQKNYNKMRVFTYN